MLSIIIHVFYSSQNDYRMFLFVLRVYVSICYYWFWLGGRFGTNLPIPHSSSSSSASPAPSSSPPPASASPASSPSAPSAFLSVKMESCWRSGESLARSKSPSSNESLLTRRFLEEVPSPRSPSSYSFYLVSPFFSSSDWSRLREPSLSRSSILTSCSFKNSLLLRVLSPSAAPSGETGESGASGDSYWSGDLSPPSSSSFSSSLISLSSSSPSSIFSILWVGTIVSRRALSAEVKLKDAAPSGVVKSTVPSLS